jgi:hypothetical protein
MNSRRAVIVLACLGVLHNMLRVIAALLGAKWDFFNYLKPFHLKPVDTALVMELAGAVAVLVFTGLAARASWRKPASSPSMWSSALGAAASGACLGVLAVYAATVVERNYGWSLFVLVPFLIGFQAALMLRRGQAIGVHDAILVSLLAIGLLGGTLLVAAIEGAVCLVMALPIAAPLAMLGGVAGHALRRRESAHSPITLLVLLGLTPYSATLEHALQLPVETFTVTTAIEIQATPQRVWQTILAPARLGAPTDPLLRSGIAFPLASHIEGAGLTATRYCDFSTGKLVEPVVAWEDGRRLRFVVASNPLPMQEWTPYARIHPPHLEGFLASRQGEFRLEPLPDGRTRLLATTWYQHHLWPGLYWRVWSDHIIHKVHAMVLANIRERAIAPAP